MKNYTIAFFAFFVLSNLNAQKTTIYCNQSLEPVDLKALQNQGDSISEKFAKMGLNMQASIETVAVFERKNINYRVVNLSLKGTVDGKTRNSQADSSPNAGDQLLPFELTTIYGEQISSEDLKGKVTLINFWFTTCPPCVAEIPALEKLKQDYEKKGVNFLTMSTDAPETIHRFLVNFDWNYQHIAEARDYTSQYASGYPVNLLIAPDGKIVMKGGAFASMHMDKNEQTYFEEDTKLVRILLDALTK